MSTNHRKFDEAAHDWPKVVAHAPVGVSATRPDCFIRSDGGRVDLRLLVVELMGSQRQFLAEVISSEGLDPLAFEWLSSAEGDLLIMAGTGFTFVFKGSSGFVLEWRPGVNQMTEGYGTLHSFSQVEEHVRLWLKAIKREIAAVDPWTVRREMVALLGGQQDEYHDDEESPFSPTEQAAWHEELGQMQHHINGRLDNLVADDAEFKLYVARQFDVLRELLPTKGKRAWRTLLRDFLVNIAATATWQFGPAGGQAVVDLVQQGLPMIGIG